MHFIEWGARELESRMYVSGTVIVWDENEISETSETARFEMGLLKDSDWSAKWITGDYIPKKKERYPVDCFRKAFLVDGSKKIVKARAYMTACGVYEGKSMEIRLESSHWRLELLITESVYSIRLWM